MIRLVKLFVLCALALGCRSTEKTTYSVETTSRTGLNPYDVKIVDKIEISITLRKQW